MDPVANLYFDYANVLVFTIFAIVFVVLNVTVLNRLILMPSGHADDEAQKGTTYECGEPPMGSGQVRFDMRFYVAALVFLIFDVEVAFLYPWAVVFRRLIEGSFFALIEVGIFIAILFVGLIYVWAKGDLNWVKETAAQSPARPPRARARRVKTTREEATS